MMRAGGGQIRLLAHAGRLHVPLQISRLGVTVAAVVHQPSWQIFAMFADLLLLCEGGRTAYYGPVSNVQVSKA